MYVCVYVYAFSDDGNGMYMTPEIIIFCCDDHKWCVYNLPCSILKKKYLSDSKYKIRIESFGQTDRIVIIIWNKHHASKYSTEVTNPAQR